MNEGPTDSGPSKFLALALEKKGANVIPRQIRRGLVWVAFVEGKATT
jgi:hypothetical protein